MATEKQKPAEAPKAWRGKPGKRLPPMPKLPEPKYGDSLGKRIGNKLFGMFTGWMR